MKYFDWSELKNVTLKAQRGIGFEHIIAAIAEDSVLNDLAHPNRQKYPNQRVLVILCQDYVYLVPYVEDDEKIFLKTIIPSRKATKQYMKGEYYG